MADNNNNNDNSNQIAIAALVISIGALLTTLLQVAQQYLASADGFRRCAPSVMGDWSTGSKRKFSMRELRFEVVFEAPVIFTAPPTNTRGPIKSKSILKVTGSNDSYKQTQTRKPEDMRVSNVHTADDERASWVTLLEMFQKVEHDSREWDGVQVTPRGNKYDTPQYTIQFMMQKKKRSWDFMPTNIIKPFATTTLCHTVEMMAMMGVYWKQIDVEKGNMRAEGNGLMLTSTMVHGLGIVTTFSMTGAHLFKDRRVIPCQEIKELVFGTVPCILDRKLQMGEKDLPRTLKALGLTASDEALFKEKNDRTFMFAISFELIAMVANPFRIRGSNFRMLPNPCPDVWSPHVDMLACMRAFHTQFDALYDTVTTVRDPGDLMRLIHRQFAADRFSESVLNGGIDLDVREAAHTALDEITTHINNHIRQPELRSVLASHISAILAQADVLERALNGDDEHDSSKEDRLMKVYFDTFREIVIRYSRTGTMTVTSGGAPTLTRSNTQQSDRSSVWLALIFRMWCWFLLHDFDETDKMIVPSQFLGSRMPVFIG